jgi:hypothetical protein
LRQGSHRIPVRACQRQDHGLHRLARQFQQQAGPVLFRPLPLLPTLKQGALDHMIGSQFVQQRVSILSCQSQHRGRFHRPDREHPALPCRVVEGGRIPQKSLAVVLERAGERGWLDLPAVLARLRTTNCYLPTTLVRDLLARAASSFHVVNEIPERSFILFRALTLSLSW